MAISAKLPIIYVLFSAAITAVGQSAVPLQPDSAGLQLSELNVVALKQDARIREDAVSATVIGRAALEELNTVSLKGISDVVPNLYIPDYGSRITSSIYVRGLGARMDHPAVGLNVDNVPYLNKNAYDFDIADIESVEMLRTAIDALWKKYHGRTYKCPDIVADEMAGMADNGGRRKR